MAKKIAAVEVAGETPAVQREEALRLMREAAALLQGTDEAGEHVAGALGNMADQLEGLWRTKQGAS